MKKKYKKIQLILVVVHHHRYQQWLNVFNWQPKQWIPMDNGGDDDKINTHTHTERHKQS